MSLDLHWTLPDPAAVCRTFTSIKVFRSTAVDGVFAEVSTPDTRPALRPDQARYTFRDATGNADTYYCSSFFNASTLAESSRSAPQRGKGDPALQLLSVARLKSDYLWGMKLEDRQGNPLPDAVFETGIRTGLAYVERSLGFSILSRTYVDEPHDYQFDRQSAYGLVHTDNVPLQSIQSVRLRFPGGAASQFNIPTAEVRTVKWEGAVQWVPGGLVSYPGYSLLWSQFFSNRLGLGYRGNSIPGGVELSYTAGFKEGEVPADLLDLVAKAAALQPLAVAGDLVGPPGVSSSSISLDGLGQSVGRIASQTGNAYASRSSAYMTQLQADLPKLKAFYLGMRLRVL